MLSFITSLDALGPIMVSYAFEKDTKGERHGNPVERLLTA
jgi:hypothetical protein